MICSMQEPVTEELATLQARIPGNRQCGSRDTELLSSTPQHGHLCSESNSSKSVTNREDASAGPPAPWFAYFILERKVSHFVYISGVVLNGVITHNSTSFLTHSFKDVSC